MGQQRDLLSAVAASEPGTLNQVAGHVKRGAPAVSRAVDALVRAGLVDRQPWTAYLHFTFDALLVSAGVHLTGGVNSLFTTMYALPILAASTVQLRGGALRMAALNATLFVGIVIAQYWAAAGALDLPFAPVADLPTITTALYIVGLNVFGFFAVAMLSGSLAERAPATIVMEACGTAHFWGRQAEARCRWLYPERSTSIRQEGRHEPVRMPLDPGAVGRLRSRKQACLRSVHVGQ